MRVLITRHRSAADRLETVLQAKGYETIKAPLLEIVDTGAPVELAGVQAILATSTNGVAALARAVSARDMKVLAVGNATAAAAREAGFVDVESAGGNAAALAALAQRRCVAGKGRLLHIAGGHVAGHMAESLKEAGFAVDTVTLYEAQTPERLDDPVLAEITGRKIDAVLFYSPRTAATFVRLIEETDASGDCSRMVAVCLSEAVASAAAPLKWRGIRVAGAPNGDAMLEALESVGKTDGSDEQ